MVIENSEIPLGDTDKNRRRFGLSYIWWFLRRYPVLPGIILSLLVIAAIFGPSLAPYERDIGAVRDRHLGMGQTSEYSDPISLPFIYYINIYIYVNPYIYLCQIFADL